MKRVDLRKSKEVFKDLKSVIKNSKIGEVLIVLFEIKDFSLVEKSFEFVKEEGCELLNSLKFNQVDWSITIRRAYEV